MRVKKQHKNADGFARCIFQKCKIFIIWRLCEIFKKFFVFCVRDSNGAVVKTDGQIKKIFFCRKIFVYYAV